MVQCEYNVNTNKVEVLIMTNDTKITARMNPELKSEAEDLLADMGLNFSVFINIATKALVNERKFHLKLKLVHFIVIKTCAYLRIGMKNIKKKLQFLIMILWRTINGCQMGR